jgi:hypothetical protein
VSIFLSMKILLLTMKVNDVPAIAAIDCADVKAVLAAHYEASAKSDYSDSIGASISTVTSMSHTLTTGCNSFENKVCNAAAISDFKMSIGSISAIPPIEDDLFRSSPVSFQVDLDDLESMIEDISASSADIKATLVGRPTGVTAKHLPKVWKIDVETAKKTI